MRRRPPDSATLVVLLPVPRVQGCRQLTQKIPPAPGLRSSAPDPGAELPTQELSPILLPAPGHEPRSRPRELQLLTGSSQLLDQELAAHAAGSAAPGAGAQLPDQELSSRLS